MKKLTLLFISFLLITCSNNDDSSIIDPIIGSWNLNQRTIDDVIIPLEGCERVNVYNYKEDQTYTELLYAADVNTPCLQSTTIEFEGTWERNDENGYLFTNPNNGTSSNFNIEFTSSNTFIKSFLFVLDPNDPITQTIKETYTRIQ